MPDQRGPAPAHDWPTWGRRGRPADAAAARAERRRLTALLRVGEREGIAEGNATIDAEAMKIEIGRDPRAIRRSLNIGGRSQEQRGDAFEGPPAFVTEVIPGLGRVPTWVALRAALLSQRVEGRSGTSDANRRPRQGPRGWS